MLCYVNQEGLLPKLIHHSLTKDQNVPWDSKDAFFFFSAAWISAFFVYESLYECMLLVCLCVLLVTFKEGIIIMVIQGMEI